MLPIQDQCKLQVLLCHSASLIKPRMSDLVKMILVDGLGYFVVLTGKCSRESME
jgi:hypothetical protein